MPGTTRPPYTCQKCRDRHFVFSNQEGRLHAALCECFRCEKCGGTGRVFTQDDKGLAFYSDCECARFKKRLRLLSETGIPAKFSHAEFDTYMKAHPSQGTAKRKAMDFVKDLLSSKESFNRGLVFMGPPGLGKTHLAVSILKALVLQGGVDCKFVDFFQLLADIRHGYSEDMSDQAIIRPYEKSRVLVVDELAKGRNTEWELTVLDQLISSRYNSANKVTLFTTNYPSELPIGRKDPKPSSEASIIDTYTRESLQEKIGARIYSRLAEMCDFVMMQGQDFRQKTLAATQRYPRVRK